MIWVSDLKKGDVLEYTGLGCPGFVRKGETVMVTWASRSTAQIRNFRGERRHIGQKYLSREEFQLCLTN